MKASLQPYGRFTNAYTRVWLFPSILLCGYLVTLSEVLPSGVNQSFARGALVIAALLAAILLAGSLMQRKLSQKIETFDAQDHWASNDVWLLLLPMTPVVQYLVLNTDIMSWADNLKLAAIAVAACGLVALVVPVLLRRCVSRLMTMCIGLSLCFALLNMASLSQSFAWHKIGDLWAQLSLFLIVTLVCIVIYRKDAKTLYAVIGFYFVGALLVTVAEKPLQDSRVTGHDQNVRSSRVASALTDREIKRRPDIFLLTYDSYVENETLMQYGIDNSEQEAYLEKVDFEIHRGTYSVAGSSINSMGRVLGRGNPRQSVAGDGALIRILEQAGYETHGTFSSGYFFRGVANKYEHGFPPPSPSYLVLGKAILEGQFLHNVDFQSLPVSSFVEKKRSVMRLSSDRPQFLYTHTGPGHSQNSGACRQDEVRHFEERLMSANQEMRGDVETILSANSDAIIIVNGDHGPNLTKNCTALDPGDYEDTEVTPLDIQDRFGTFLAIRWPDSQTPEHAANIEILQDLFPAILAYLYDDEMLWSLRSSQQIVSSETYRVAGVTIRSGRIVGGRHDGQPLFESSNLSSR